MCSEMVTVALPRRSTAASSFANGPDFVPRKFPILSVYVKGGITEKHLPPHEWLDGFKGKQINTPQRWSTYPLSHIFAV